MAGIHTSKVTSAGNNGNIEISPDGTGKIRLTQLASAENQIVGVDSNGDVKKFFTKELRDVGQYLLPTDHLIIQADYEDTVHFRATVAEVVAAGSGGAASTGPNPPSSPNTGDLWFDPASGKIYVYYNDGNSQQWVVAFPSCNGGTTRAASVSDTPPLYPDQGDLWYDTISTVLNVWEGDKWITSTPTASLDTEPYEPVQGQIWWDSADQKLKVYRTEGSESSWIDVTSPVAGRSPFSSDQRFHIVTVTLGNALTIDATLVDEPLDTSSVSYEWYKDNQLITGLTTPTIETQSLVSDHLGVYTCRLNVQTSVETLRMAKVFVVTEATPALTSTTAIGGAGPIYSLEFQKNGSGYTNVGPVTLATTVDSGSGDGTMTLECTSDGDAITSVAVVNAGTGYKDTDVVRIATGDENGLAFVTIDATLAVNVAGTGYTAGSYSTTGGSSTGAFVEITVGGSGEVLTATVNYSTFSNTYAIGDVLTIVGGDGNAEVEITALTTNAAMTTGGSGYTNTGPVTVNANGGSGSNATVEVTSNGENIISVTLVNPGTGYFTGETLTVDGGDNNAPFTIKV